MKLVFNTSKKNTVKLEIPGVETGKGPLWVEISQATGDEIDRCSTSAQVRSKKGAYISNEILLNNIREMVASHIHGWNLLDDKENAVECTTENAKHFISYYGNTELKEFKINRDGEKDFYTIKEFVGEKIQNPKTFISGDQKN